MTVFLNSVNLSPAVGFTGKKNKASNSQPTVSYEQSVDVKPKKQAHFQGFRKFCAGVQKFFISAGEYAKGTVKGLLGGAVGAAVVLGVDVVRGLVKKSTKIPSTGGKIIAGAVGATVLGVNLFKSYLNTNGKNANVDHRWKTGHNEG